MGDNVLRLDEKFTGCQPAQFDPAVSIATDHSAAFDVSRKLRIPGTRVSIDLSSSSARRLSSPKRSSRTDAVSSISPEPLTNVVYADT